MIAILIYLLIILSSVTQSASNKAFIRKGESAYVFNAIKAASSFIIFLLIGLPGSTLHIPTVIYGAAYGLLLSLSMYSGYKALSLGPMALTSMLVSFSVVIPLVYGLTVGNEKMTLVKGIALVFLTGAILLSNSDKIMKDKSSESTASGRWLIFVAITFAANGIYSTLQKIHQTLYPGQFSREFMICAMLVCTVLFSLAAVIKLPFSVIKQTKGKGWGVLAGVTTSAVSFFTLIIAGLENASVLFPIISAGTIVAVMLCGRFIFKEKLKANHYIALAFGICAVILLKL